MKNTNLIFLILLISSCGNKSQKLDKQPLTEIAAGLSGNYCYAWVSDKDSVVMKLHVSGQEVRGSLNYHYFEKDKSQGSLVGHMHGDTLFATYTFFAEGSQSVRDVAFLKKGADLEEGYGEVIEEGGKMIFRNRAALDFGHSVLLKSRDCP